jgi:N-methylhydantoinase A
VRVGVPDGPVDAATLAEVARRFHAEHTALYGYDFAGDPSQQVEWVNLRVSGVGPIQRPEIQKVEVSTGSTTEGGGSPTEKGRRQVCFEPADGYVDTPVLWRADLAPGATVVGPAVIEEFGSTVPLHPGFTARVDEYLNIIVTRTAEESI